MRALSCSMQADIVDHKLSISLQWYFIICSNLEQEIHLLLAFYCYVGFVPQDYKTQTSDVSQHISYKTLHKHFYDRFCHKNKHYLFETPHFYASKHAITT